MLANRTHLQFAAVAWALGSMAIAVAPLSAQQSTATRAGVLLDTDLGSDVGDAFALALILASPELELRGVTTVSGETQVRALMACRYLTMTGRRHTAVAAGADPQPAQEIVRTGQYRYYYHPDVLFNRTTRPAKEPAVDFLCARLKAQQGQLTLIAAGPFTNIARLLVDKPDCKPWIKRIVWTATESNLRLDAPAARAVLSSGVPLRIVPAASQRDRKLMLLGENALRRIFAPKTALSLQVEALHQLWDRDEWPNVADALAAATCFDDRFVTWKEQHVEIDDSGALRAGGGKPNASVATSLRDDDFRQWFVERMENCVPPARKPVTPIERGPMPNRVHVAEDYDNDIERFWWMSGKAELKNLPPGSRRACRGTLTHDFDDLLGNPKAMHTAVIFNPVPGPPMGKRPRLSFRYWLKGTDSLRVQIYSLTNGYHRHLVLSGLPQERWQSAAVDMSLARRPDGTGGPLSEGERIDDIQFYADPAAELVIDDVVLYDAAASGEKRPFPRRILFTAWFDSGKQGKEWPGTFEIVEDGYFGKAARSISGGDGSPQLRIGLRGRRTLGQTVELCFRYRLKEGDSLTVELADTKTGTIRRAELSGLDRGKWAMATARFANIPSDAEADEIRLRSPKGAEMLVDDVLLYGPESE